jgi:Protein of unknown function with HXXEE motif
MKDLLIFTLLAGATGWERIAGAGTLYWWIAGPLIAASLHVFEEFVLPGGFRAWYASYRPTIASSLSAPYLVVVNGIMLGVCALIAIAGPSPNAAANWFIMTSILFWNAIFHVRATVRMRRYSPGVISAVLLYIPLTVFGSFVLLQHRLVPRIAAVACFGIGGGYHVVSLRNHQRRAQAHAEKYALQPDLASMESGRPHRDDLGNRQKQGVAGE